MTYAQGVEAYARTQVTTATSQKALIVMAYDGILRFLGQAREHMIGREIEATHTALSKARAIIEELAATLNLDNGGQIARNLWNLYVFFIKTITEANFTKDPALIEGILPAIHELREGWAQLEIPKDDVQTQALNNRVPSATTTHRISVAG